MFLEIQYFRLLEGPEDLCNSSKIIFIERNVCVLSTWKWKATLSLRGNETYREQRNCPVQPNDIKDSSLSLSIGKQEVGKVGAGRLAAIKFQNKVAHH